MIKDMKDEFHTVIQYKIITPKARAIAILKETPPIMRAEAIATYAHQNQTRNRGPEKGQPYIEHPKRVWNACVLYHNLPPVVTDAAWLHDVLEDTEITKQDLIDIGINPATIDIVESLSKKPNETYFDFIFRLVDKSGPYSNETRIVKLEDLMDNMKNLEEGSLKDKYRFAHYILSNCPKK